MKKAILILGILVMLAAQGYSQEIITQDAAVKSALTELIPELGGTDFVRLPADFQLSAENLNTLKEDFDTTNAGKSLTVLTVNIGFNPVRVLTTGHAIYVDTTYDTTQGPR